MRSSSGSTSGPIAETTISTRCPGAGSSGDRDRLVHARVQEQRRTERAVVQHHPGDGLQREPLGGQAQRGQVVQHVARQRVAHRQFGIHLVEMVLHLLRGMAPGELPQRRAPVIVAAVEEDGGPGLDDVRDGRLAPAGAVRVAQLAIAGERAGHGSGQQRIVTHRALPE
ncbi:hypothetical protein AB0K16_32810 [Nonomuraea jabiensis]|uniref:hypothetical protein n=1 Tax=Nonomuraea jabiensis TaxID=882448 RepID=UPI003447B5EC